MASYTITYTSTMVAFEVVGLTYGCIVRFYVRYNPDPGYALVDETYTATSSTMTARYNLAAGQEYAVNVGVNTGSGNIWIGGKSFSTPMQISRPENWYWHNLSIVGNSYIAQGSPVSLSARVWNAFCSRINDFRRYKGLANYSFTTVYSGGSMYAWQANQAIIAINEINGHGVTPAYVYTGYPMTARFMFQLQDALNAIT